MARLKSALLTGFALFVLIAMSWLPLAPTVKSADGAIGFSLSPTHGTVAIRNLDGSFDNVASVDGNPEYLELMERLSLQDSTHPSDGDDMWRDIPRQLLRRSRKTLGFAPSRDVAILSDMLNDLRGAAEAHLRDDVNSVVIAYPRLAALYEEDIRDAGDYLKLQTLEGRHFHQPHELVAAFAGHGLGLCEQPLDMGRCLEEEEELPTRDVLSVHVTGDTFVISFEWVKRALDLANWDLPSVVGFGTHDLPSTIGGIVLQVLEEQYGYLKKPSEISVIFTGRDGASASIREPVVRALSDFQVSARTYTREPEFIAARGAAELAWRSHELGRPDYPDQL